MSQEPNKSHTKDSPLRIPLKWLLIVAFGFQSIGIIGLTGWLAFHNSRASTNRLVSDIQEETAYHIESEIDRLLLTADTLNKLTVAAIQSEQLDLANISSLDNFYWSYLTTFSSVRGLSVGNAKGELVDFYRKAEDDNALYYREQNNLDLTNLELANLDLANLKSASLKSASSKSASLRSTGKYISLKLNARREIVESVASDRPVDAREQPWYRAASELQKPTWTKVYSSVGRFDEGTPLIGRSRPVFDNQARIQGVVSTIIDLEQIETFLSSLEISPFGVAYILQADGKLVTSSGKQSRLRDRANLEETPSAIEASIVQSSTELISQQFQDLTSIQQLRQFQIRIDDQLYFVQVQPIAQQTQLNWLAVVVIPRADFIKQNSANNRNLLYLCVGALCMAITLGVLISSWLLQPIDRLIKAATQLSLGNLSRQKIRWHGVKEIDVLAQSLSLMERDLQESFRALQASEQRFRRAIADAPFPMMIHAEDGEVLEINDAWTEITGYTHADIPTMQDWTRRAYGKQAQSILEKAIAKLYGLESRFNEGEFTITTKEGTKRIWKFSSAPLSEAEGRKIVISMAADITMRHQSEIALRESQERLQLVTENMSDLVCLHETDGRYLYVTPSSQDLLGYRPEELIGKDPYELFHPEDRDHIRQNAHKLSLKGRPTAITYRLRQKSGKYIWLESLTQPIYNNKGEVVHLQTTSRNVSDRIAAEAQLRHDALHDRLTELPNRSFLMAKLKLTLEQSKQHPENKFAVLFLDLDHFKVINDSLGHLVGDELLISVSKKLTQLTRQGDLVARLGGDEFVILIEETSDTAKVIWVAERILTVLKRSIALGDRKVFIGASIGVVFVQPDHHRPEDILRDADLAMYRAKHKGRGQYALFEPAMRLQVIHRLHVEHNLRQALDRHELVLHYQPILHLKTMRIRGFEALVRWQHPERGLIPPAEFIEIAEETGLIVSIGQWILNAACEQLAIWESRFPHRPINVSVNLSVQQLQESLLQKLEEIAALKLLKSNSLTLEITESMLIQNMASTQKLLSRIRAMGIRLSIDDFGTGYSCLSYLHQLPVNALKIDRTFVSPASPDARNQAISESIIALTNQLGLDAIAEGVETPQQLKWLKDLGCEFGQGFLFASAYSATQATELLQYESNYPYVETRPFSDSTKP